MDEVYILFKNGKIIYVGRSMNMKQRIDNNKSKKDFDSYSIVYRSDLPGRSAIVERAFILSLSMFSDNDLHNKSGSEFNKGLGEIVQVVKK